MLLCHRVRPEFTGQPHPFLQQHADKNQQETRSFLSLNRCPLPTVSHRASNRFERSVAIERLEWLPSDDCLLPFAVLL